MFYLSIAINVIFIIVHILCIVFMLHMQRKKNGYVLLWLLLLIIFPFVGFIIYLIFADGARFFREKKYKKKFLEDKIVDKLILKNLDSISEYKNRNFGSEVSTLLSNLNSKCVAKNNYQLFFKNEDYFNELLTLVENTQDSICIQTQKIIKSDNVDILRELLIKKANEGVDIKILFDDIGSRFTNYFFFKPMIMAGIKIATMDKAYLKSLRLKSSYVSKRNLIIVDNNFAFIGNCFLENDEKKSFGVSIKVSGQIIDELNMQFFKDFNFASGKYYEFSSTKLKIDNINPMQFMISGADTDSNLIDISFNKSISIARRDITIITNSFFLSTENFRALKIAVLSGVIVNIFINLKKFKIASLYNLEILYNLGANIYLCDNNIDTTFYSFDNKMLCIGSQSVNHNDSRINFENCLYVFNNIENESVKALYEKLVNSSKHFNNSIIKDSNCFIRLGLKIYKFFAISR